MSTLVCGCGILYLLIGCAPVPEPSLEQDVAERQRRMHEEMVRSTAEWAYKQGLKALRNENFDEAVYYFQLATERDAMHLRAYLSLGEVYTMQDQYARAETYYNKVLRYDPYSVPAYLALANMQVKAGNFREALQAYKKVLELDRNNQFARQQVTLVTEELFAMHYEQGMMYEEAGDIDLALREFQKAHALNQENIVFTVHIGELFLQQGDYTLAEEYFNQALARDPNYVPAIVGAGKVQLAMDRYDEAIEYFEEGMGEDSEAAELFEQAQSQRVKRSLPTQYQEIFTREQVARGDVAALLMVELLLEHRLEAAPRLAIISDVTNHWAKPYIINAVRFGVMELPPDRFFRPDEPITKGQLAFILDTLFQKLFLPLPQGKEVSFADVHPDNEYHDAVIRVYSAGLMYASSEDKFGFLEPVSGEEMRAIIERVKPMIR